MSDPFQRPKDARGLGVISSPSRKWSIELLGAGATKDGVALSRSEFKYIRELYGIKPEENPLLEAGASRNVLRHAACDGLRMLAWFAKYVPAGTDPVKLLVQITEEAGFDVPLEDSEWAGLETQGSEE